MSLQTLFTYGPANVDVLLTTTQSVLSQMSKDGFLNDAVFNTIPLLDWLQRKNQVTKQGGASILAPILSASNSTFAAYNGLDLIDTTAQEGMTMAQYKWKNYAGTIALVGDEMRANGGQAKLFDYVKAKTQQAVMTARNTIAVDLFASSQDSKKVEALPVLVDATSTVADINSTTNSFWQAQVVASGSFAGRGLADMRDLKDRS